MESDDRASAGSPSSEPETGFEVTPEQFYAGDFDPPEFDGFVTPVTGDDVFLGTAIDGDASPNQTTESKPQRAAKKRALDSLEALTQQEQKSAQMEELITMCWSKPGLGTMTNTNESIPYSSSSANGRKSGGRSNSRKASAGVQRPLPRTFTMPINNKAERRRRKASIRERARVVSLNEAFQRLKSAMPFVPPETKLSKIKTLRFAICYVRRLMDTLKAAESNGGTGRPGAPPSAYPRPNHLQIEGAPCGLLPDLSFGEVTSSLISQLSVGQELELADSAELDTSDESDDDSDLSIQ